MLDVAVVGGGQAGLAMGFYLQQLGLRFQIFDSGTEVGHVWRSRWDSLRLFTPAHYASLPAMAFPAPHNTYPSKNRVADYLQVYAEHFDLPIRHNTTVTSLDHGSAGYILSTTTETVYAKQVVVATGPFHIPTIPDISANLAPDVVQLHSNHYRNPDQVPGGKIVVVGGGNSGFQIAAELAHHRPPGTVSLAIGTRNVCIPQRPLGRDIFSWQHITGLINAPVTSRRGQWMRRGEGTVIGVSTRDLHNSGVTLHPRLTAVHESSVHFADDTVLDVDAVVWATGFRRDFSWIAIPEIRDKYQQVHHDRGITAATGLYVLGQPWQHTAGSALLGFVKHDAHYLAENIEHTHREYPRYK